MTINILLGPVLSFRGASKGKWKVSALIGIDEGEKALKVVVDGKAAPKSKVLLKHGGRQYLRYDLTMDQGNQERKVEYTIGGVDEVWHFTVPGKDYAPRMAYVSCNGFSDPSSIRKLIKGENAVWADLLCNHDRQVRRGYGIRSQNAGWVLRHAPRPTHIQVTLACGLAAILAGEFWGL